MEDYTTLVDKIITDIFTELNTELPYISKRIIGYRTADSAEFPIDLDETRDINHIKEHIVSNFKLSRDFLSGTHMVHIGVVVSTEDKTFRTAFFGIEIDEGNLVDYRLRMTDSRNLREMEKKMMLTDKLNEFIK